MNEENKDTQEEVPKRKRGVFEDTHGREWHPQFTSPVLIHATRRLGITLASVTSMELCLGDLLDATYYACEEEAKERGLTQNDFWNALPPAKIFDIAIATTEVISDAFPKIQGGAKGSAPLDPGELVTSLISQVLRTFPQAKSTPPQT